MFLVKNSFFYNLNQKINFFSKNVCIFYIMYFWSRERAANIHLYANISFPLISSKIGCKTKIFLC